MAAPKPMERKFLHRILLVAFGFSLLFGLIWARLYFVQVVRHDFYFRKAKNRHIKTIKITPQRGSIYSSDGRPIATSTFQETAYFAPRYFKEEIKDPEFRMRLTRELAKALSIEDDVIADKLKAKTDQMLKRKLTEREVQQLVTLREEFDLPSPTIYFVKEGERRYPQGSLAAHVIGFTARDSFGDNIGIAGAEAAFNKEVAGKGTTETVEVSVSGQNLSPIEEKALLNACGNDVYLTIDENIQHYAESALAEIVEKYKAKGGICIAMEIGTGAIMAMASYPTFDINERGNYFVMNDGKKEPMPNLKNKCLVHPISPGSVMKVFTSTALFELNKMSPYEMIDCEGGLYQIGRRRIKDAHKMGLVPMHMVFAESSNIGYVKLGLRMEAAEFYSYLTDFGFGRQTGIEFHEEAPGFMYPLDKWQQSSRISLPIGYELRVSAMQVISAMAAIANKGQYYKPHILKEIRTPQGEIRKVEPQYMRQICKPQTSDLMMKLMEEVVTSGTGKSARVPGYRVGGKTGTTVKDEALEEGEERGIKRYYASFIGVIPLNAPRLAIYAWIDEPHGAKYGGEVAAPIFQVVASNAMRILGIEPTEPITSKNQPEPVPLDDSAELVQITAPALPPTLEMGPIMPDVRGLTIREALPILNNAKIDAELTGWGICTQQQPIPGGALPPNSRALIMFTPPNETPAPKPIDPTLESTQSLMNTPVPTAPPPISSRGI